MVLKDCLKAVLAVFPKTDIQLCIVHLIRNSLKYVSYKDRKEICASFKLVYEANNQEVALKNLEMIEKKWICKYPYITKSYKDNWP